MSSISNFTNMDDQSKIGEIMQIPANGGYVPAGYLAAQGNVVSQSTYSELYSKVGLLKDGLEYFAAVTSGTTSSIYTITYGDSGFIYGAARVSGGEIYRSTDGITWTSSALVSGDVISSTYGNGLYVCGTSTGGIHTSTNGITWTARTSGVGSAITALTYGNGLYIFGSVGGVLRTSTDGITWDARTSGTTSAIRTLAYGNGLYVYGGDFGALGTSTDGITWTARTSGITSTILRIAYGNGIFMYEGSSINTFATSTDGITWKLKNGGIGGNSTTGSLIYANGVFVSIISSLASITTNGEKWFFKRKFVGGTPNCAGYGNGIFLAGGGFGGLVRAPEFTYNTSTEFVLPSIPQDPQLKYKFYVKVS